MGRLRLAPALMVTPLIIFFAGFAVGRGVTMHNLSKYESPAQITEMDWNLLQAQVDGIRFRFPDSNGVGLPNYSYDADTDVVTAHVLVDEKSLSQRPESDLKKALEMRAVEAEAFAKYRMPEISERNFAVQFRGLEEGKFVTFAEYKNGELIFH